MQRFARTPVHDRCTVPLVAWVRKYATKSGVRYQASVRVGGRLVTRSFPTERAAKAWAHTTEADRLRGASTNPARGRVTVATFVDDVWLPSAAAMLKPSTIDFYTHHLRRNVLPCPVPGATFGDLRLEEVDAMLHVAPLVAHLRAKLAPRTVASVWRVTRTVFRAAVRGKYIALSPCEGIKVDKPGPAAIDPRDILTAEQVWALADSIHPAYRAAVLFGAGAGVRHGEAFGLRAANLDLDAGVAHIREQLHTPSDGGAPYFTTPKTPKSVRTVPLPGFVVDAFGKHLADYPPTDLALPVFRNTHGDPVRRSAWGAAWHRGCRRAGVTGATFRSLRHFYASALIRHGEDVKTVMERLGHSTLEQTMGTYARLWPGHDDRTRGAIESALLPHGGGRHEGVVV